MNKDEIIKQIIPGALATYKKYRILPSVTIAQAILETGWLQHIEGNNVFGIKWTKDCGFDSQQINTHEWINGTKTSMRCTFRKYDSLEDSIQDHGKLLTFSRYKEVIDSNNYKEACNNLYKCGYCTDNEYAEKLIEIIEENKLYVYDHCESKNEDKLKSNIVEDIKYVQKSLNLMNIKDVDNNVVKIDDTYGPMTISAVKNFQRVAGLLVDGRCGPKTMATINEIMKKPICSMKNIENKTTIRYLQWRLNINIDGVFGNETFGKVKEYQIKNKLVADGVVGQDTWGVLLS
jgi:peptidoglycan hydrolase-like protein with peptidoglycan-binding domain